MPSRLLKRAHLLRWRPRSHAQRTGSTPRVPPSGAASHLDPFEPPAWTDRGSVVTRYACYDSPVETFSAAERAALEPYFTNLDGPVFALVNLPEVVKGALFAR